MTIDPRIPLFLHIPKTAGTTLAVCVYDNYADPELSDADGDGSLAEGVYYYPAGFMDTAIDGTLESCARTFGDPNVRAVVGHFRYGIHRQIPRPSTYITLLRHPVERAISLYHHVRRYSHAERHEAVARGDMTLEEFVRDLGFPEVDNGQTRRISGLGADFGCCTGEMLSTARRNLRRRFSVVGVQERFDESLMMMKHSLGWPNVQYTPELVNREKEAAPSTAPAVRELILERNELAPILFS